MKATEAKFLDFLKKSPQFHVPIYQRICFVDPNENRPCAPGFREADG